MNEDLKMTESIRDAINACTHGVDEAPSLRYRVLQKARGEEEPMKKKITASMILVTALVILSITAAVAAGLGLFGKLAGNKFADERLTVLQEKAEDVQLTATTKAGTTVTIDQAIYEGNHVYISWRAEGQSPELSPTDIYMTDNLYLEDDTCLNIIAGESFEEDGCEIGWKECEIPEDLCADTLTFKTLPGHDVGEVVFTLARNKQFVSLAGSLAASDCQARAEVLGDKIDTMIKVYADYPEEQIAAWNEGKAELFDWWYLYQDGRPVDQVSDMGSTENSEPGQIVCEEFYVRLDSHENLTLSPYDSEEYDRHPEAIMKLETAGQDAQPTPMPHAE